MLVWSAWVCIFILFLIIELMTTSTIFLCLSLACLPVIAIALGSENLETQLSFYGIFVLGTFYWLKPVLIKTFYNNNQIKTNADALIGQSGKVLVEILPNSKQGRVLVGGDDWRAVSADDSVISVGQIVIVEKVESNTLIVRGK